MKTIILFSVLALSTSIVFSQNYQIDAPEKWISIRSEHIKMGGMAPDGSSIEVNNFYMLRNGMPIIPIMGEFHYSRYPANQWEQEILKIKAGGINVVATYVFWNLHEEIEGEWNWTGNRNLRQFIRICQRYGMDVIVRIGPFAHGEIRSGGLPDWLFTKNIDVRSNDAGYLTYTNKLYKEIANQLEGLYYQDGGPIIGCQIENEHQHSAAPWAICYKGETAIDYTAASYDKGITKFGVSVQEAKIKRAELGNEHMRTLLDMAKKAGINTPLYTTTGWGNAAVIPGEAIPVTAGYTYATWVPRNQKSEFCLFKNLWQEPDYSPVRYNPTDYPSASAEMGVGIQIGYAIRPVCTAEAAEALMVRTLGGGSNIIGYYMYHGGSTPRMQNNGDFLSDQPVGLPKISYDFQAPLGEFGLENVQYRPLRILHYFLNHFGNRLAPMQPVMPTNVGTLMPDNRDELRYAARMNSAGEGFLFLVNSQDHDSLRHDLTNLRITINLPKEHLTIPEGNGFTLPKNTSVILPFNFQMDGALLKYATAQPLMVIDDHGTPHYFFSVPNGMSPAYAFDPTTIKGKAHFTGIQPGFQSTFCVKLRGGKSIKVTILSHEQALNASCIEGKLLVTKASVLAKGDGRVKLLQLGNSVFDYVLYPSRQGFKPVKVAVDTVPTEAKVVESVPWRTEVTFNADVSNTPQVNEYFLKVHYIGDLALAFTDNKLVHDHFWQGKPWLIGLNRYAEKMAAGKPMGFYFRPLRANAPFLEDLEASLLPDFSSGPVLEIKKCVIVPEYTTTVVLSSY